MAITRHKHVNETGHAHVFQVDSKDGVTGTVHIVKPDGTLGALSSTNPAPILALPQVDEDKPLEGPPEPVTAEPVTAEPVAQPPAEPTEEATPLSRKLRAKAEPTLEPAQA